MKDAEAKLRRRGLIALAADTIASGQICLCAVNAIASNKTAIKGAAAGWLEAALQPVREVIGLEGAAAGKPGGAQANTDERGHKSRGAFDIAFALQLFFDR